MPQSSAAQTECVTNTELISPCNRETDLFDIGFLIAELRWRLRVAVFCFSDSEEENAKACVAKIQPLLSSLFPDHRGGTAYEAAEEFRRFWNTLHTEWFAEESHAAFNDNADVLEVADVVRRLQPFVERVDEAILTALMAAYRENDRLLRALQLGRCVGEGLYPKLSDDEFFEVVDNPKFDQWSSTWCGAGFSWSPPRLGERQPPSKLIRSKRINAGELEPDMAWSSEVRTLLAAIGLIGPLPISLDLLEQSPDRRSATIQTLSVRIRTHFQVASVRGTDRQVSQQLLQTGEPESAQVRSSEAIPCPQPTGCEHHVDVRATSSPGEKVEAAGECGNSVNEVGTLGTRDSPPESASDTANVSSFASEAGSSGAARRSAHSERRPWSEWKVDGRIVTFREQQRTFTQANAELLKAIISGNRWQTVDEVCATCFAEIPSDNRNNHFRSALSRLNAAIRAEFAGLPHSWNAVRRVGNGNSTGERLLKVVMPDVAICEPA